MQIEYLKFPLDPHLFNTLKPLVPEHLQMCLKSINPFYLDFAKVYGIVGLKNHTPISIAFISAYETLGEAEVHCVSIDDKNITAEEINQFISFIDDFLKTSKTHLFSLLLEKDTFYYKQTSKSLNELFWKGPHPLLVECHFVRAHFNPGWLYKKFELSSNYNLIKWGDLDRKRLSQIEIYANNVAPLYINPFGNHPIETQNSLVLFYKEEIAGWMITHRISEQEIRYSALYLDDKFKRSGLFLKLLSESLFIHAESIPNAIYGTLEVNLDQIPHNWFNFVQQRLFPLAYKIVQKDLFWKNSKTNSNLTSVFY